LALVVEAPLFGTVASHIGLPQFEHFAILEYYSNKSRVGEKIWGAGGARQHEVMGFCVISYYLNSYDLVLLVDIYFGNCASEWYDADKDVFKKIIRDFRSIRKDK